MKVFLKRCVFDFLGQTRFLITLFFFYSLASGSVPDYVYVLIGVMIILVFLLAAAVVYIMYQRRLMNARPNA